MSSSLVQPRRSTRRASMAMTPSLNDFSPITKRLSIAPSAISESVTKRGLATPKTPLTLSNDVQTPKPNIPVETPKTRYPDIIMTKLHRDLNSPSAAARFRANKALKSPNFRNQIYGTFDVPHEHQDLLTEEERMPYKPKTIPEVFANCKIYVEVRTGDDNRSAGIKNRLLRDGIAVNEKLYKDTTHVIFKDGLLSTYKNALKLGIPVINILWIDACISQKRLVDTVKFKISNLDRYERPELYKRIRRQKSMQPEISSLCPSNRKKSMSQDDQRDTPKPFSDLGNETIAEQDEQDLPEMELTLQNTSTSITAVASMEIATPLSDMERLKQQYRRLTTFTPDPMEQTGFLAKMVLDRRRTMFTPQLTQKSDEQAMTPESNNGFSHDSSNTIVFNSINRIGKTSRRSVFDISMNIFEMNCKALSSNDSEDLTRSTKKRDLLSATKSKENNLLTQALPVTAVRKRKLFICETDDFDDGKENFNRSLKMPEKVSKLEKTLPPTCKTPQSVKKSQPKVDRRRTMTLFKTEKPKEVPALKPKTPVRQVAATKYIVCTNMSLTDKLIIHAAITKLGGKVESEVSVCTTHIVSPNEERTMNVLRGVIRACTIVNVNWVHDSLAKNKWLDTAMYHHGICDTNRVYERSVLGTKNYKNLTFANHGLIYLNQEAIENPKKVEYLKEIIGLCEGLITNCKYDAKFIITDKPMKTLNNKQIVVLSTYIFDAAMKGSFLETALYQPKAVKV